MAGECQVSARWQGVVEVDEFAGLVGGREGELPDCVAEFGGEGFEDEAAGGGEEGAERGRWWWRGGVAVAVPERVVVGGTRCHGVVAVELVPVVTRVGGRVL